MKKPTLFGKYLLLERVNVGGMAEVFIAKAFGVEGFERILAIKKILPTMAEDEEFITMFIDEARISVQLNHANVVHIHELGKHDEAYFIAMEYVSGRDLRTILERYRRRKEIMPTAQAVFVASKICEGLDYAHRRKDARGQDLHIIHRDVSPQNILISYEGEVKIIDFGIAKAANRSQKTQAGILKGKFGYMSPEQVRGLPIDRRSDVFAVGVILYEMLTGEKLFVGESDFSTLEKVRNAEVPAPRQFNPNIPSGLEKVLMKALAREAEDRYQWGSDLQEDLMRFLLAGDAIYSSKHLAGFVKEAFAEDLQREEEKMLKFAAIEKPEALESSGILASQPSSKRRAAPATVVADPLAVEPPSPDKPKSRLTAASTPIATVPAGPGALVPPPSAAELAEMDASADRTMLIDGSIRSELDLKTMVSASPVGNAPAPTSPDAKPNEPELVNDGTELDATLPPRSMLVASSLDSSSSNAALRPLEHTGFRPAMEPLEEDPTANHPPAATPVQPPPKGARSGVKPKIVIGDAPAYNGATMVGPSPLSTGERGGASRDAATGNYDAVGGDDALADDPAGEPTDGQGRVSLADGEDASTGGNAALDAVGNTEQRQLPSPIAQLLANRRVLALVGGGALLLLLLTLAAVVLLRNNPAHLAVWVDPDVPFTLQVSSQGADPKIYDGAKAVLLDPGEYIVDVIPAKKEYLRKRLQVRLSGSQNLPVNVKLELANRPPPEPEPKPNPGGLQPDDKAEAAAATFVLIVTADEEGVELTLDGKKLGKTPGVKAEGLASDKLHKLVAKKEGFKPVTLEISNPAKQAQLERHLVLERDAKDVARPEPKQVEPKPEPKQTEVVRRPEPKPEPKQVEPKPEPKQTQSVVASSKAKGRLACNSRPTGAEVWVDGKNSGKKTPLPISSALELTAGKHKVVFKLNGKASAATEIIISEGETSILKNIEIPGA